MHKRFKQKKKEKNIFIKSMAFWTMLCLIIGNIYIPALAEEESADKFPAAENGGSIPDDLENKNQGNEEDQPEDSKDETKIEDTKQNEKEPGLDEEGSNEEDTNKTEPEIEDDSDKKEENSGEDLDEKEQEEPEGEDDENTSDQEIKEDPEAEEQSNSELEIPEIINVVVPGSYILALNPYSLPIWIGEDEVTTEQVISGNYGIINKSSTDQIVTVSLMVEDSNDGELVFVDSAEEALNAEEGVYAVYLAAVPADTEEVLVDGASVDGDTTGEALQNVQMTKAQEHAVTLYAGENQVAFKLGGAVYHFEESEYEKEPESEDSEDELEEERETPEIIYDGLAPDGLGVTAYTFCGAMNPNASWERLSGGIKISVVYTYRTADGSEEIIEGTGAMIYPN